MATRRQRLRTKLEEMAALTGPRNRDRRELAEKMQRNAKFRAEENTARETRYMAALVDPPTVKRLRTVVSWLRQYTTNEPSLAAAISALETHADPEISGEATRMFESFFITKTEAQTRLDALLNTAAGSIDPNRLERLSLKSEADDPVPE